MFSACEDAPKSKTNSNNSLKTSINYGVKGKLKSTDSDSIVYAFPNVPQEVIDKAIQAYNGIGLPAITIAITYSRGNSNISLETGWKFYSYSTPVPDCFLGEDLGYQSGNVLITNDDGFVFIEEEELCGIGNYIMDNRQGRDGGWFDYVCGPSGFSFDYTGEPVFVLVRLWCE